MNQKDYQQSMQYIEKFYQQAKASEQRTPNRSSNSAFDDLPRSITEESSMFDNEHRNKRKAPVDEAGNGEFAFNNFDQSERFDDSVVSEKMKEMGKMGLAMKAGGPVDMLGVSIDSQSIDQSLIN